MEWNLQPRWEIHPSESIWMAYGRELSIYCYISIMYLSNIYLSKYIFILMHLYPYLYCLYIMSFSGCSKDDAIHVAKTLRLLQILLLSFLFSDTHSRLFIHSLIHWFNKCLLKRDDVPDTHYSYDRNERQANWGEILI